MSIKAPSFLYTAEQSRAVDREAIDVHGLPGSLLMARAARAAFDVLCSHSAGPGSAPALVQILCGAGNNGGDGLLLAMLARARGIETKVILVDGSPRSEDAMAAAARAQSAGVVLEDFTPTALADDGVIVDAMLGTGISGEVRPQFAAAIDRVNTLSAPVLALDVPSGIDSDTGAICGAAVRATWTMSFITPKRGLYTGAGEEHAGVCFCDDLDVPAAAYAAVTPVFDVLQLSEVSRALPSLNSSAHKGQFGRCLLVGGDHGMGGAVILAAEAALRTGVGLLRVATREVHLPALLARRPEAMATSIEHRNALLPLIEWADAIIVGPGLGQDVWGEQMLHACLNAGKPLLVDADALNLLAKQGPRRLPPGSLITPHPGEAARLMGAEGALHTGAVQRDRFAAAQQLADTWGATVVLKGNGSLIVGPARHSLCVDGNPGMASGGMGDVLSGVAGALLAQGLSADDAAALAVVVHAQAGDKAALHGSKRALLASDLIPQLGELLQ